MRALALYNKIGPSHICARNRNQYYRSHTFRYTLISSRSRNQKVKSELLANDSKNASFVTLAGQQRLPLVNAIMTLDRHRANLSEPVLTTSRTRTQQIQYQPQDGKNDEFAQTTYDYAPAGDHIHAEASGLVGMKATSARARSKTDTHHSETS